MSDSGNLPLIIYRPDRLSSATLDIKKSMQRSIILRVERTTEAMIQVITLAAADKGADHSPFSRDERPIDYHECNVIVASAKRTGLAFLRPDAGRAPG